MILVVRVVKKIFSSAINLKNYEVPEVLDMSLHLQFNQILKAILLNLIFIQCILN